MWTCFFSPVLVFQGCSQAEIFNYHHGFLLLLISINQFFNSILNMLQDPASRVSLSGSPCREGRGHKHGRLFPSLSQILRNWQSLTRRTPEISRRTPRLTGKLLALGKKTQRTPGSTDSEKLTSCSQKAKHSTTRTQSARNTEFFDVTRRLINKIAPRQTG